MIVGDILRPSSSFLLSFTIYWWSSSEASCTLRPSSSSTRFRIVLSGCLCGSRVLRPCVARTQTRTDDTALAVVRQPQSSNQRRGNETKPTTNHYGFRDDRRQEDSRRPAYLKGLISAKNASRGGAAILLLLKKKKKMAAAEDQA